MQEVSANWTHPREKIQITQSQIARANHVEMNSVAVSSKLNTHDFLCLLAIREVLMVKFHFPKELCNEILFRKLDLEHTAHLHHKIHNCLATQIIIQSFYHAERCVVNDPDRCYWCWRRKKIMSMMERDFIVVSQFVEMLLWCLLIVWICFWGYFYLIYF